MISFEDWPVIPKDQRPKPLYHMSNIDSALGQALIDSGWEPIDLRLLPERTGEEKVFAIKAWLQGVRLGSVMPYRGGIHFSELEARVYGLLLTKRPEEKKQTLASEDLDQILKPLEKV